MNKPTFLILSGDGINCEIETARAFNKNEAKACIIHINELIANPLLLDTYDGLAIPGGFSFGDELGSGQVLALKIKHKLMPAINGLINRGGAIIGICNGFQVLTKLGLLPSFKNQRTASLIMNKSGHFINRWIALSKAPNTVCKWLTECPPNFNLPVRHAEGRLVFTKNQEDVIFNSLYEKGQIPLFYDEDINGSYHRIAALCDESGLIFGLMPHPEAATTNLLSPGHLVDGSMGQFVFKSIIKYFQNKNTTSKG